MRLLTRVYLAAVLAIIILPTGGCAFFHKVEDAYQVVTQTAVAPSTAAITILAYNGFEATATNYNSLPRCTGSNGPVCRDPAAREEIRKIVLSGRVARDDVKQFLRNNPGQPVTIQSYQDLLNAKAALEAILAKYKAS